MPHRDDLKAGRVPARLINRTWQPDGAYSTPPPDKTLQVADLKSGDTEKFGIERWGGVLVPPCLQINQHSPSEHREELRYTFKMNSEDVAVTMERLYGGTK